MLKKLYLAILLLLALTNITKAQQSDIKFEHLSVEEGLSEGSGNWVLQDHQGIMWFGTEDGLNKYDGYTFTVYRHNPQDASSLSDNFITTIFEDSKNILWVGTYDSGLNRFDPKSQSFTVYRNDPKNPNSLSNNKVISIYEGGKGTLWVGTAGGLNKFDPISQTFTSYRNDPKNPNSLSRNTVWSICEDSKGTLWVGTLGGGLNKYDPKSQSFTAYRNDPKDPNSLSNNNVNFIYEDSKGTLWVGTGGGLNKFDPISQSFTVYRNDPKNPNSLSNNNVRSICEDSKGMLWIGTHGGGVNRFDPISQSFTVYSNDPKNPNSLSGNIVLSICIDRAGTLWFGIFNGGINKYDPNSHSFNTYRNDPKNPNNLSSNDIGSIYEDSKGTLWVGTAGGLNKFDPISQTFTSYRNDPLLPTSISNVSSICEDSKGMLWIGTFLGGLNKFDPISQSFTSYRNDPSSPTSLSSDRVFSVYEDSKGTLWVGTYDSGLNKFDPISQSFTSYRNDPKNPNSLSNNKFIRIYEDSKGTLWVGTGGGLNKYDPKSQTFTSFTEKDGLPDDSIWGILEDKEENLWLSTNRGISKFNPKTKKFKNFNVNDGLQSNEFNSGAYYKSRSGEMFFGGINGFNRFYPEQIKDNPFIPPIVITAFKIFDKPAAKADFLLDQSVGPMENLLLELSYKENFFSFEFAALNYTHPEKNQYAYKMEGFDKDWIYGTRRYANYTNLDPGEYVFRVKGSNNDGVWNEKGIAVRIRITPPPWRTWWAYLLYFASLASVGYRGYRYRLNAVERRYRLERAVEIDKKNRELESKNDQLARQKEELSRRNEELVESHQRADRIFSALAEALPGTVLDGKYLLDEKIGSGGFGAVYHATHLAMKRPVAVKVFKPAPGNDSADALQRFQLEAISACRINHPNAVAVLDSGISSEGIAYLVMELLEGHTLTQELRRKGALSIERTAQILAPVCEVLAKAHSMGIVHRDIKPDNIFLHRSERGEMVKVVDFGIAKLMESTGSVDARSLTGTGGIIGTPTYMSPERLEGKPYDGRSDVYGLGVMLYEMLSGRLPFQSDSGGVFALVQMHLTKEPRPLREINPSISQEVEAVVLRALAKDPNNRPTAGELGQEFFAASGTDFASLSCTKEPLNNDSVIDEAEWVEKMPTLENESRVGLSGEVYREVEGLLGVMLQSGPNRLSELLRATAAIPELQKDMESLIAAEEQAKRENCISPERWQQIRSLFFTLMECEPDRRTALLDEACRGDLDLRRRVEALIAADE